ncbi:hypothetical protein L195_g022195 [Trifolium pratense]|uniref:Uncharacterized protein n=1 Tax=Trifolium pratense TaxID=57577 RepID=A0A2K3N7A2_TRIPR|nr:hypothetical protein L195_g022195 [Trifolium pratense]
MSGTFSSFVLGLPIFAFAKLMCFRELYVGDLLLVCPWNESKVYVGDLLPVIVLRTLAENEFVETLSRGPFPRFTVEKAFGRGQRPRPNVFNMSDTEEMLEGQVSSKHRLLDTIMDPALDWVAPEPRGIASTLTPGDPMLYTIVEDNVAGPVLH